ncbi:MAG: RNA polymerase sigma factor, partial [Bacteroidales bacterium]|nr:RNA polymerase sigma factor [Bacteroidales bacterium]
FVRIWQNIGEYDTAKSFVTWIYTIATRLCLDRIKAKKHTAAMPDDVDALARFAADTDSQVNLENSEWVAIVRLLASRLSDKQKTVFTLCQLEGLDTTKCSASPAWTPHKSRATSTLPVRQYANN